MPDKLNYDWTLVMNVDDGKVEFFADALVITLKDSDITFSITGKAFEFLKDQFNTNG